MVPGVTRNGFVEMRHCDFTNALNRCQCDGLHFPRVCLSPRTPRGVVEDPVDVGVYHCVSLYVVRELTKKRIWFGEPLVCSSAAEVRRLMTPIETPAGIRTELDAPRPAVEAAVSRTASPKIQSSHLDRLAVVYIRQSSPHQVVNHRESRERQYALADHAVALGWPRERVLVIDDDQGRSGKTADNRTAVAIKDADASLAEIARQTGDMGRW